MKNCSFKIAILPPILLITQQFIIWICSLESKIWVFFSSEQCPNLHMISTEQIITDSIVLIW